MIAAGHEEVRFNTGEWVGHPDGFAVGEEDGRVLVCQGAQRRDDFGTRGTRDLCKNIGCWDLRLTLKEAYTAALTSRLKIVRGEPPLRFVQAIPTPTWISVRFMLPERNPARSSVT